MCRSVIRNFKSSQDIKTDNVLYNVERLREVVKQCDCKIAPVTPPSPSCPRNPASLQRKIQGDSKIDLHLPTNHVWHKEILKSSQPVHIVLASISLYLAIRILPGSSDSPILKFLYFASISSVFGTQFWMTFVSGIALFLNVQRHIFARVQMVLFPIYFLINTLILMVAIVTFFTICCEEDSSNYHQAVPLLVSFAINFLVRLYLSPFLTKLIMIKMAIEKEAGMGFEVASSSPGILANCPHYMKVHKSFRCTHIAIAIGNMISFSLTTFNLYYISSIAKL